MATSRRAWQKGEQYWAETFGEERTGPRGKDLPDTTNDYGCPLAIEHKLQDGRTLRTKDLQQAKDNAAKLGLPWVLILHEKGTERLKDDLIIMDATTFLGMVTGFIDFAGTVPAETFDTARELLEKCKKN